MLTISDGDCLILVFKFPKRKPTYSKKLLIEMGMDKSAMMNLYEQLEVTSMIFDSLLSNELTMKNLISIMMVKLLLMTFNKSMMRVNTLMY